MIFKSKYINDTGSWTKKAVDDGFVKFDDYIKDIQNPADDLISFNNKQIKLSDNKGNVQNKDNILDVSNNFLQNSYTMDTEADKGLFAGIGDYIKGAKTKIDVISYWINRGEWSLKNLGVRPTLRIAEITQNSGVGAEKKAKEWGLNSTENNLADAYRHFTWNAEMTRDKTVGYYDARNICNRYEYEYMRDNNWISSDSDGFDYKLDNTIIKGKMNQPMLMDLWNNQVGRELSNNAVFSNMSVDELFEMACDNGWLITDANEVYDFLGISDYKDINYTVDVEWNLSTGNISFKKGNKQVTLKIGV